MRGSASNGYCAKAHQTGTARKRIKPAPAAFLAASAGKRKAQAI
jgi:hypothetical protein